MSPSHSADGDMDADAQRIGGARQPEPLDDQTQAPSSLSALDEMFDHADDDDETDVTDDDRAETRRPRRSFLDRFRRSTTDQDAELYDRTATQTQIVESGDAGLVEDTGIIEPEGEITVVSPRAGMRHAPAEDAGTSVHAPASTTSSASTTSPAATAHRGGATAAAAPASAAGATASGGRPGDREVSESSLDVLEGESSDTSGVAVAEPSIARSSALMALGSMVSRVLGLVRQSLLTSVVATMVAADAFAVANTLPNYIFMLLSAGLLNAVLIPQITKAMKRPDGGEVFVNRLVTWALTLVIAVTVVATLIVPWLVRATSEFSGAAYNLTVVLAYVCVPQIAFYGIYAVLGQVLNARNQFAAFMWAPVLANVVQIIGLVWFLAQWGSQPDPATWTYGMVWVLAGSSTLGIVVQALALVIPLARGGYRFRPVFRGLRGSGLGDASRMAAFTFIALLISMGGGIVVSNVLTAITNRPGNAGVVVGYAGQQYAFLVFMIPHSFITTSVLTALFPRMTRSVHDGDADGLRRLVRQGLVMPATAVVPASIGLAVLAIPMVRLMFHFRHPHDAVVVGMALSLMAIGTLPFGVNALQQRYCFAREDGWLTLWMQIIVTGGQVLFLMIALVAPDKQALLWAAAGQSVGNAVAAAVWLWIARRQIGSFGLASVVRLWVRLLVASLVAGILSGFVAWGLTHPFTTRMGQLVVLAVAGTIFVVTFWVVAQLLRITEVDDFVDPILRRIPGVRTRLAH